MGANCSNSNRHRFSQSEARDTLLAMRRIACNHADLQGNRCSCWFATACIFAESCKFRGRAAPTCCIMQVSCCSQPRRCSLDRCVPLLRGERALYVPRPAAHRRRLSPAPQSCSSTNTQQRRDVFPLEVFSDRFRMCLLGACVTA